MGAESTVQTDTRNDSVRTWHFEVLLDNKSIGFHDFSVTSGTDGTVVTSRAAFNVTRFGIRWYRYEHSDHEVWRQGCLSDIDALTDDNGRKNVVRGGQQRDHFELQASTARASLPGCIWTFAYWDERVIWRARLLNAQTGEYQEIKVDRSGREVISVKGEPVSADHCTLRCSKFVLELWYSQQGEWLALGSRQAGGSLLRYQLR